MLVPMLAGAQTTVTIGDFTYKLDLADKYAELVHNDKYKGYTDITIPGNVTYNGDVYTVNRIGSQAFMDCKINTVTFPNTITHIGSEAFYNSALTSLILPQSVCIIEELAFAMNDFTELFLGSCLFKIGDYAFQDCGMLEEVTCMAKEVPYITESPFDGLSPQDLTLYVPNKAKSEYSKKDWWKDFGKIEGIRPEEIKCDGIYYYLYPKIGEAEVKINPYSKYEGSINIPRTVTYAGKTYDVTCIGESVFSTAHGLTSVTIPNSIIYIGAYAFEFCGLTSVDLPNSVIVIGKQAFTSCHFTSVTIPNSVLRLVDRTFAGNTSLTTVTFGNSLENVNGEAFETCSSLREIVIGSGARNISNLGRIPNPQTLTCLARSVPHADASTFGGLTLSGLTLRVPAEMVEAYKKARYWQDFGTIIGIAGSSNSCAKPTITYVDGKITAVSTTEGAKCHVSASFNLANLDGTDSFTPTMQLIVTAFATAAGYTQSETATATFDLANQGDLNGDGEVSVADVTVLVDKILKK